KLEEGDGDAIGFLAARAAGYPDADVVFDAPLDELRKHNLFESAERLGVAEKTRDVDEQVARKRGDFGWVLVQEPDVRVDVGEPNERHPSEEPSLNGRRLVLLEVNAAGPAQEYEDLSKLRIGNDAGIGRLFRRLWLGRRDVGMRLEVAELFGQLARRQDE